MTPAGLAASKTMIVFLALAAVASWMPLHGGQEPPVSDREKEVGFVRDLHGSWVDDAYQGRALGRYSVVRSDSRIRSTISRSDYFITIRIFGIAELADFSCSEPTTCPGPIDLQNYLNRRRPEVLTQFRFVLRALKEALVATRPVDVNLISRGADLPDGLRDGIVVVGRRETLVGGLFQDLPSGRYKATFTPLAAPEPPLAADLAWSGGNRVELVLKPGVYQVELQPQETGGAADPVAQSRLILAVNREDYDRAVSLLDEGRRYAATWSDANPLERRILLRYLMLSFAGWRQE